MMRIDKFLWFVRLVKTRSRAQQLVLAGHIRLNGRRVDRPAHAVTAADLLTIPIEEKVLVLRVSTMPQRRGPAPDCNSH